MIRLGAPRVVKIEMWLAGAFEALNLVLLPDRQDRQKEITYVYVESEPRQNP